jgi:hypothetical protein
VGEKPNQFLNLIPQIHTGSLAARPENFAARLNRLEVRSICLDPAVTPEAKYACMMAWGGQSQPHFSVSVTQPGLVPLINYLLGSVNTRMGDFAYAQAQCARISGLKISFYTKLLFFLRPTQDSYILDQWTAKSINLIQHPHIVRLTKPNFKYKGACRAMHNTTPQEYEAFCQALNGMHALLWPLHAANGEDVEMAMFDRNRPDGFWRKFTRLNFAHPVAGKILHGGAESLTQAFDFRSGYLIIRQILPSRIFVIQIHGSCCHWSQDDCYRFLLARLKELLAQHGLPVTLVLPLGLCPAWFTQALDDLGIETTNIGWNEQEESHNENERETETGEIMPAEATGQKVEKQEGKPII